MADPTYDYIPNVTTETLLHGLVCQRQEQYASPTQKGWQFGGTKTVTLYIPEAIFYNKSDATIRFLIGCDFANTSVTRTYTVTSNNSNYTISRLTNNYAAKWGFYSNDVTRTQLLANGTFDYSVTW